MTLEILTPEKKLFEGEVSIVTFPGADGSFQVMDHHAPLVSLLAMGIVSYRLKDASNQTVKIQGGIVEVLHNKVIVLAEGIAG